MKTTDKHTEKDNFSQIIRNKLENYSLPIEKDSWDELEKRLDTNRRRKIALWPWISGVSAAASIALIITLSYPKKTLDHETTNLSYHAERIAENVPEEENLSFAFSPDIQIQPSQQRSHRKAMVSEERVSRELDVVLPEETVWEDTETPASKEVDVPKRQPDILQELEPIAPRKSKDRTKSIALHISSGGQQYSENTSLLVFDTNKTYSALRSNYLSNNSVLSNEMLSPDDFNQITHRPPVSVGLSLRKGLTDYLSLESGLTYTYLYSTFENRIPRRDASLTLHYLGVPINLSVNLLPRSRSAWNVYFSAGGMVEKGLLSHYVQNTYSSQNDVDATNTSNERIGGLQWSAQAGIGAAYRLNRDYSIFLEPKVIYYFDNNQPFNARTEHPFVPGVNVGLRRTW